MNGIREVNHTTILIDDSGTGDLIGDAFIVFWRRETNDQCVKRIPLELYQTPEFNEKSKFAVKELLCDAFKELNVPTTEEIFICSGPIFDEARKYLTDQHFNFQIQKIEGWFQDKVEQIYVDYLTNEISIPENTVSVESGKKRFFALFHWISQDYPRRNRLVKSGFEKWQTKWASSAEEEWMKQMVKPELKRPMRDAIELIDDNDPLGIQVHNAITENPPNSENPNGESGDRKNHNPKLEHRGHTHPHGKSIRGHPGRKEHYRKEKPSYRREHHHDRDGEPRYTSTNPDPRQKFF